MNNLNIFSKLKFILEKPVIIVLSGKNHQIIKDALLRILKNYSQNRRKTLILEADALELRDFKFLIKNSSLPILAITDNKQGILEKSQTISKMLPEKGFMVLNFDNEEIRSLKREISAHLLTFGFQEGAEVLASDMKINGNINFKINHKGNIVPVWLKEQHNKEQVYSVLGAVSIGTILELNLVEISQALAS